MVPYAPQPLTFTAHECKACTQGPCGRRRPCARPEQPRWQHEILPRGAAAGPPCLCAGRGEVGIYRLIWTSCRRRGDHGQGPPVIQSPHWLAGCSPPVSRPCCGLRSRPCGPPYRRMPSLACRCCDRNENLGGVVGAVFRGVWETRGRVLTRTVWEWVDTHRQRKVRPAFPPLLAFSASSARGACLVVSSASVRRLRHCFPLLAGSAGRQALSEAGPWAQLHAGGGF